MTTPIRVLLCDDHTILREGLASLLATAPDIQVVGQAADGIEAIELALKLRPQVVVTDISMPATPEKVWRAIASAQAAASTRD